jgi:hypothetical protein
MEEPTVLDYVKSKLAFWRRTDLRLPDDDALDSFAPYTGPDQTEIPVMDETGTAAPDLERVIWQAEAPAPEEEIPTLGGPFPWRVVAALVVALFGQNSLNSPDPNPRVGVIFYALSAVLTVWAAVEGEFRLNPTREEETRSQPPFRWEALVVGIPLAFLSFVVFGSGLFTAETLTAWLLTLAAFCFAFWAPATTPWVRRAWAFVRRPRWKVTITPWMILGLLVAALVIFFRVYRLGNVPPEMVSDHAEKLLDVSDVLAGKTAVFFPRNTGREFFQFYLTAAVIQLLHTGVTFISLKIGTVLMGLITLPYIYLIGKEIGNKRVALLAVLFAGIAYWPNVITRIALRFTLYPAFYAPMIYYLIRGLRRSNRNDFIFAGIALGFGLNGYSPYRIVPFVVLAAVGIYLLHQKAKEERIRALVGLGVTAVVSLVIFIPLFRYTLDHPEAVLGRSLTRLTSAETPLPGPAWKIFLGNLWNALTMFFWQDGNTWVHSIPGRPALETVSAALFFIGLILVIVRYIRRRSWVDLFMLVSIPLLMLPSILSLAFPIENPSLNRTGGAIIPVFLIIGIGLDEILTSLRTRLPRRTGTAAAWMAAILLVGWSAAANYDLVFNQYYQQYQQASWNTTEIGRVIRGFADSVGSGDSAWVVAYPYWVDTRLVGINAGYPAKDYAIDVDQIPSTVGDHRAKLFIVNEQDQKALTELRSVYPRGSLSEYTSAVPGKNFLLYQVPPG